MKYTPSHLLGSALILVLLLGTAPLAAENMTSSDLLLPYFEVDVQVPARTTLFSIVNSSSQATPVEVVVYSNWGLKVLEVDLELRAFESRSLNLYDWIALGRLPESQLGDEEIEQLQSALCGMRSAQDGRYRATEVDYLRAVGYVTIRSAGQTRPNVLLGDYAILDPNQDTAQGELLINLDNEAGCASTCRHRAIRFLSGGGFDGGTQLMIWTERKGYPSTNGYFDEALRVQATLTFYSMAGERFDQRELGLLPLEILDISDLGLDRAFGWLELETEDDAFVGVRYSALGRFSIGFQSFCMTTVVEGRDPIPAIDIEKHTNGFDADAAPGPQLTVGDDVTWEYIVTNKGETVLSDVTVEDDRIGAISCPKSTLGIRQSMTCSASGVATEGQYQNLGTVTGTYQGQLVTDSDPSHYFGTTEPEPQIPAIDIEKATNGVDADTAPGPQLTVGDAVTWTYVVTNTGDTTLTNVAVTDDQIGAISCPKTTLSAGQSMTCAANGTAVLGQYENVGTVTGRYDSQTVSDADPSHYFGEDVPQPKNPAIDIEKATNGVDADTAPGPQLTVGDAVTWTYVVTNTGDTTLTNVAVTDDRIGAISCPKTTLNAGQSMTCTANGTAIEGQYENLGTVTGLYDGQTVSDADPSHYFGESLPPSGGGDQGCTPGYWKNHEDSWPATGFATGQSVPSVFAQSAAYADPAGSSLHQALYFSGGSGVDGAVRNLMRAAVASLLDASHPGVDYPRTTAGVIADVDSALASGDRDTMLSVAAALDADNNLGCPLN